MDSLKVLRLAISNKDLPQDSNKPLVTSNKGRVLPQEATRNNKVKVLLQEATSNLKEDLPKAIRNSKELLDISNKALLPRDIRNQRPQATNKALPQEATSSKALPQEATNNRDLPQEATSNRDLATNPRKR